MISYRMVCKRSHVRFDFSFCNVLVQGTNRLRSGENPGYMWPDYFRSGITDLRSISRRSQERIVLRSQMRCIPRSSIKKGIEFCSMCHLLRKNRVRCRQKKILKIFFLKHSRDLWSQARCMKTIDDIYLPNPDSHSPIKKQNHSKTQKNLNKTHHHPNSPT